MSKPKFKVGDTVQILQSAVDGGVSQKAVGKRAKITMICPGGYYNVVVLDYDPWPYPKPSWAVYPNQVELVIKIGQQLTFAFMK